MPQPLSLLGTVAAPGQHHLAGAVGTDDPRHAHAGAAADEDAATPLGQLVEGRRIGDAHVGGHRQLETATDHCAVERGDDRQAAELHLLEGGVPVLRVAHHLERLALAVFGEIQPGREVLATTAQHHHAGALRRGVEQRIQALDQRVVDGVALVGAVDGDVQQAVVEFQREVRQRRQGIGHRRLLVASGG